MIPLKNTSQRKFFTAFPSINCYNNDQFITILEKVPMFLLLFLSSYAETDSDTSINEINATFRTGSIPDEWLDSFFSNGDPARPTIATQGFGLEWSSSKNRTSWMLYYEYIQNQTPAGYWDDLEDPLDRTDGVWVKPVDLNLHTLGFQSNFAIDIPIQVEKLDTDILFGGGLGIGILTGSIERWHNGVTEEAQGNNNCLPIGDAITREALCGDNPDASALPIPVLPVVDLSISARIRYDRFTSRFMFGIHNNPYIGFALGARL